MPANTSPIFGLTPNVNWTAITNTAVNTGSDGSGVIGTNLFKAFTAGSNGSFVQKVRYTVTANTSSLTSVATTLRAFISDVGTGAVAAADSAVLGEVSVPAISVANAINATNFYDYPVNFAIPSGSFVLVGQHVAQPTKVAWSAMVIGSDY